MAEEKKGKIMIVEDDTFVMDIYQTKLSSEGFEVIAAMNGQEAIDRLEKETELPNIILLDIIMPRIDGLEVLKRIKANDRWKDIPVILLTNLSQKEEIETGLGLGAKDYMIKSHFTPMEVLDKIKTYLT